MKKLLLVSVLSVFYSCHKDAKEITQNGNFKVEYLFEQDGCKMYRFRDGGHYIYWSNCKGSTQSTYVEEKTTHTLETPTTINN